MPPVTNATLLTTSTPTCRTTSTAATASISDTATSRASPAVRNPLTCWSSRTRYVIASLRRLRRSLSANEDHNILQRHSADLIFCYHYSSHAVGSFMRSLICLFFFLNNPAPPKISPFPLPAPLPI